MKVSKTPASNAIKGSKRFRGRQELIDFTNGKKLPASASIKAYCYGCMGEYADGADDCGDLKCPLHPFMPYNETKTKRRVVTPETIEKMKVARSKRK